MTSRERGSRRKPYSYGSFWATWDAESREQEERDGLLSNPRRRGRYFATGVLGYPGPEAAKALLSDPLPASAYELVGPMLQLIDETVASCWTDGIPPARIVFVVSAQLHRAWCGTGPLIAVPAKSGWPTHAGVAVVATAALPEGVSSLSERGESPRIDLVSYYGIGTGRPLQHRHLLPTSAPPHIAELYNMLRRDGYQVRDAIEIAHRAMGC